MSIKLMTLVWELDLAPGEKLVLLALADQANDQGVQCWPSLSTIARRSGQNERTVRRALRSLETKGHMKAEYRPGTSTQYVIYPGHHAPPVKMSPRTKTTETPDTTPPKPLGTTIPKKDKPSLVKRATRIPPDFAPVMSGKTASVVAGWPPGRLEDELEHFADHHTAKGTTSYDWQASWRTWVKNSKRWEPRNGNHGQPVSLRGSRPDPSLDFLRKADADLAAERRGSPDHWGDRTALPAGGTG